MPKIVSIHQPNYIPYLGFFDKMNKSDIFVVYDDAPFNKRDFHHRNRIRIHDGSKWLSIPVEKKNAPINKIKINNNIRISNRPWSQVHYLEIYNNYKNTPFFDLYSDELEEIYNKQYNYLVEINLEIINFLSRSFGISTEILYSSKLDIKSHSSQKNYEIVKAVGGDCYLSGPDGKSYLDESIFRNVKITYQDFEHPIYQQKYEDFKPYMGAIDALFNIGPKIIGRM